MEAVLGANADLRVYKLYWCDHGQRREQLMRMASNRLRAAKTHQSTTSFGALSVAACRAKKFSVSCCRTARVSGALFWRTMLRWSGEEASELLRNGIRVVHNCCLDGILFTSAVHGTLMIDLCTQAPCGGPLGQG